MLKWFGLQSRDEEGPRRFARNMLTRLSAGLFQRTEKRFAGWPYRLQWLIATGVPVDVQQRTAQEFVDAPACCLGSFGRGFRQRFPTPAAILSAEAAFVLATWQVQLQFSAAPVECEHKQIKEESASITSGRAHAPAANRAVCRHWHQAHVHRGGADVTLKLRKSTALTQGLAQGRCWPQSRLAPLADNHQAQLPEGDLQLVATEDSPGMPQLASLGGDNPKVMFLNYKLQQGKQGRGGRLTKVEAAALRSESVALYDQSATLRER